MTWSVIRQATDADRDAVASATARFCLRHRIDTAGFDGAEDALNCACDRSPGSPR